MNDRVNNSIASIQDQSRADLVDGWIGAYGRRPNKGLSRRLLEYAAAYHVQAQALGGLKPAVQRKLRRLMRDAARGPTQVGRSKSLPPGTRLVRHWHGRTYTVYVVENGFLCDGRQYRSLSEVARTITGAHWSGPRFFGL